MEEYLVPTGFGEDAFIEKKSRFIGRIWPVESEEEALARIQEMKKRHYDATHNCWAYILRDGPVRFSDDGEPGGTAGMPMLQVLQREELYNVVCVVTRYFGGILLGAGGLQRAYAESVQAALMTAKLAKKKTYAVFAAEISFKLFNRVKPILIKKGYKLENIDYRDAVFLDILVPKGCGEKLLELIGEVSGGTVQPVYKNDVYLQEII